MDWIQRTQKADHRVKNAERITMLLIGAAADAAAADAAAADAAAPLLWCYHRYDDRLDYDYRGIGCRSINPSVGDCATNQLRKKIDQPYQTGKPTKITSVR
ncbi:hypothetical protein RGU75_09095 [Glaciimonas sp. CA11.2]|uniref:hypothetical protein n=1 Tax=Glaciimonas sp. CA11.2 TaxID=3048601 RepID=UPI002AB471F8|nr:hypothetical protein [Glaciimonas sp. CA11.2]MDY7546390.1 hypothetical protein [Glaciimonas sp. CA11.2]